MDFSDIINDLVKLEGIRLNSIRPGAEITIKEVDIDQKKVIVESSSGKLQSRPFSEFQRIWEALLASPAIRVEEVLNGSGSSRNQPETIFANLPYIQWLRIDNKKHIAYVKNATHPYGTIQQMDSMCVAQLSFKEAPTNTSKQEAILVVTNNIASTSKSITSVVGKNAIAESEGLYVYRLNSKVVVLADTIKIQLPCGTYAEISDISSTTSLCTRNFLGSTWRVLATDDFKAISRA